MIRLTYFLLFLTSTAFCQVAFEVNTSIPVKSTLTNLFSQPWSGGLNAVQVNKLHVDNDEQEDLVLFDRTANKILVYLAQNNTFIFAPEYEYQFPPDLNNFVLLRDLNGDGKKDLFTGDPFGIKVYRNVTSSSNELKWQVFSFITPGGGTTSTIITTGLVGKTNLQLQADDLPSIEDMDGDGDLDILCMSFSGNGKIEYHQNVGTTRSEPDFVRITQSWGGITECSCGVFAFNNTSCSAGGRIKHAGGKFLLAIDATGDGLSDLLFSESNCSELFLFVNNGTQANASFSEPITFPTESFANGLYPTAFFEDVDFDGIKDFIMSYGIYERVDEASDFSLSLQFFKNSGSNTQLSLATESMPLLQNEMLDVGENARPAFFDEDGDGDEDLFIGSLGKKRADNKFSAGITFYKNTGTKVKPQFEFVTDNYAGLSSFNLTNIKPEFVDVSVDMWPDLIFTATNETGTTGLYYLLNQTPLGLDLDLTLRSTSLTILYNENIHCTDINDDGFNDLLIGKSDGALEYWKNTSRSPSPSWQIEDARYLNMQANFEIRNPAIICGIIDDDSKHDLLLTDQNGRIQVLFDYKSKTSFLSAEGDLVFNSISQKFEDRNLGGRLWPALYTRTSEKPLLFIGTMLGGIQVLNPKEKELRFEVYPNPINSTQTLTLETVSNGTVYIYRTTGTIYKNFSIEKGKTFITIPSLTPGVYLLCFTSNEKTITRRLLIQ